jgi:subtilisin family serine protease
MNYAKSSQRNIFTKIIIAAVIIGLGFGAVRTVAAADGFWYFNSFNVQKAHDAGFTGKGVTIAVLDSPINDQVPALLNNPNLKIQQPSLCMNADRTEYLPAISASLTGDDDASHGTQIASLIVGNGKGYAGQSQGMKGVAPGATVLYYATSFHGGTVDSALAQGESTQCPQPGENAAGDDIEKAMAKAIGDAVDKGADIISISQKVNFTLDLSRAIGKAHQAGVIVVAALPNAEAATTIATNWPAAANGVVAVNAVGTDGRSPFQQGLAGQPVHIAYPFTTVAGPGVGILVQGEPEGTWTEQPLRDGTSLATPIVASFLAAVKEKYPNATSNQLIQTLIHNTGVDDHELIRNDELGYGIASLTHMLAVDPTKYEDVNPLITDINMPCPKPGDYLFDDKCETPTETDTSTATGPYSIPLWLFVSVAGGVILLVGGTILTIVLVKRKSRKAKQAQNVATPTPVAPSSADSTPPVEQDKPFNPFDQR